MSQREYSVAMGLDGGTYITRSDVLRGASWALSTADTSRSSRGGNVQAGTVFKRRRLDPRADRCVAGDTQPAPCAWSSADPAESGRRRHEIAMRR